MTAISSKRRAILSLINPLLALIMLFPIAWTIITSLKGEVEVFRFPPTIIPQAITWSNYQNVLSSNLPRQMFNSIAISLWTILLTLTVATPAGFAFARAQFRLKHVLLYVLVGTQMIPGLSNVITLYMMGNAFKLLNTHQYLVLIYAASSAPVCVWLMKGYFDNIPPSLDEAALVDGCTRLQTMVYIIIPLVRTGMVACAVMVFVNSWNEFIVALTMISRTKLKTFPLGLQAFMIENTMNWGTLSAATVLGLLPVLVLFLSFQRSFIEGMTSGAIKS